MRLGKNRIAKVMAILLAAAIMSSRVLAEALVLPQDRTDPIMLLLSGGMLATIDPSKRLEVFVGSIATCCEGRTPIAGRYTIEVDSIAFTPTFGFDLGQNYVARVRTIQKEALVPFQLRSNAEPVPAVVTKIFPSGDVLPENILRFYIHFSVPMQPHVAFDYIKLRDSSGNADEAAFMRFKQELWNADRTRLTVLIDPGRIKREVATNLELGPAFLAGQEYTLSVDAGWPSANGASLLPAFSRTFIASGALRERPDTRYWNATSPCLGTREPLTITFDRPFDRHLLNKDIQVVTEDGRFIDGVIGVGKGEFSWNLTPNEPWPSESLQVVADTELEDIAGNNFQDLLDHLQTTETGDEALPALSIKLKSCPE